MKISGSRKFLLRGNKGECLAISVSSTRHRIVEPPSDDEDLAEEDEVDEADAELVSLVPLSHVLSGVDRCLTCTASY